MRGPIVRPGTRSSWGGVKNHRYYSGYGGWSGCEWGGLERSSFLFADSAEHGGHIRAADQEGVVQSCLADGIAIDKFTELLSSARGGFAGIVCVRDPSDKDATANPTAAATAAAAGAPDPAELLSLLLSLATALAARQPQLDSPPKPARLPKPVHPAWRPNWPQRTGAPSRCWPASRSLFWTPPWNQSSTGLTECRRRRRRRRLGPVSGPGQVEAAGWLRGCFGGPRLGPAGGGGRCAGSRSEPCWGDAGTLRSWVAQHRRLERHSLAGGGGHRPAARCRPGRQVAGHGQAASQAGLRHCLFLVHGGAHRRGDGSGRV